MTRKHAKKGSGRHLGHRLLGPVGVAALAIIAVGTLFGSAYYVKDYVQSGQMAAVISSALVNLANEDRTSGGLSTLTVSPTLTQAAQAKANDEAEKSYFAHTSPEGKNSWYWFKQAGYSFTYAGENLAVNFSDSDAVEKAWMNSPTHRANILNAHFTQIGIATAVGTYEGRQTVFVVQMFGTPTTGPTGPVTAVNTPTSARDIAVAKTKVLGTSAVAVPTPASQPAQVAPTVPAQAIQYAAASPKTTLRDIYIVLGVIILIAVLSATGFELKRHHIRHALAGLFLLTLLGGLYAIASQFVFTQPVLAISATEAAQ